MLPEQEDLNKLIQNNKEPQQLKAALADYFKSRSWSQDQGEVLARLVMLHVQAVNEIQAEYLKALDNLAEALKSLNKNEKVVHEKLALEDARKQISAASGK